MKGKHGLKRLLLSLLTALLLTMGGCKKGVPLPAPALPQSYELGVGEPHAVSTNGSTLLVVKSEQENNEVWLMGENGQDSRKIFDFTSLSFFAAFSPDGKHLAWSADGLWLADADGSRPELLRDGALDYGPLAWSPRGDQLAFVADENLCIFDIVGAMTEAIYEGEAVRALSWVELPGDEPRLFVSDFPAEAPPAVVALDVMGRPLFRVEAELFAAIGDTLYLADPLGGGRLWTVKAADGSPQEVLLEAGVQGLAPRPGREGEVTVLLQRGEFNYELWLYGKAEEQPRQLTADSLAISPLWSPDGQVLYYGLFALEAADEEGDPFRIMRLELDEIDTPVMPLK